MNVTFVVMGVVLGAIAHAVTRRATIVVRTDDRVDHAAARRAFDQAKFSAMFRHLTRRAG